MTTLPELQIAAQNCRTMGSLIRAFHQAVPPDRWGPVLAAKEVKAFGAHVAVSMAGTLERKGLVFAIEGPSERSATVPGDAYEEFTRVLMLGGTAEARLYRNQRVYDPLGSGTNRPEDLAKKELVVYGFVILLFME